MVRMPFDAGLVGDGIDEHIGLHGRSEAEPPEGPKYSEQVRDRQGDRDAIGLQLLQQLNENELRQNYDDPENGDVQPKDVSLGEVLVQPDDADHGDRQAVNRHRRCRDERGVTVATQHEHYDVQEDDWPDSALDVLPVALDRKSVV